MKPDVSVIIPSFNEGELLRETLDSVLDQTLKNLEIIIIDNNSIESSRKIAEHYRRLLPQKIRVIPEPEQGVCSARNTGVRLSHADFIAFLDSDDRMKPTKLEKQFAVMASQKDLSLVSSWFDIITHDSSKVISRDVLDFGQGNTLREIKSDLMKIFKNEFDPPYLSSFHFPYPSTWMVRKEKLIRAGSFDVRLNPHYHEDSELLPRLFREGGFSSIPEALVEYRAESLETRKIKPKGITKKRLVQDQKYLYLTWKQFSESHPENPEILKRIIVRWIRIVGCDFMQYDEGRQIGRELFRRTSFSSPSMAFGWKLFLKTFLPRKHHPRLFWFDKFNNEPIKDIDLEFMKTYLSFPLILPEYKR